ncbi:ABC-three component system protein [Curtobacterium sp. ISL-83]|uniref:ABC-three component system protein n=1 Tax=Curtobacterium sp. ISL-83 TaxID=2819145 RepID=UPI0027E09D2C|nr:ABC-three component system protein [Curtobacterium sp. ISL-83]
MPNHDAAQSALGYLHQVDWALVEMLENGPDRPDQMMMLEQFDDVSWQGDAGPTDLLQVKHHVGRRGNLGDKSVDLWKSIKVWLDDSASRAVDGPTLRLVTTANCPGGSAMEALKINSARDERRALALLDQAADDAESAETKAARELWSKQPKDVRASLVSRLSVLDRSIPIDQIEVRLRRSLWWVGLSEVNLALFVDQLRAWWHALSVDLLLKRRPPVAAHEVRSRAGLLRDGFSSSSLPTSIARPSKAEITAIVDTHANHVFVRQLGWINVPTNLLERAIIDFWRTVEQTTVWVANHLVDLLELQEYRDNLADQWDHAWDSMLRKLPPNATEKEKEDAGYDLWSQMRDRVGTYLRSDFQESFYRNGILYELANVENPDESHGWHPEFESMLRQLTVGRIK